MAEVTICSDLGAQENKICYCFPFSPIFLPWSDGTRCHNLSFWMLSFKPAVSLSSFTFNKRFFSSSLLSASEWYYLHIWGYWYFSQQSWFQLVFHRPSYFAWCTLHQFSSVQSPSRVWLLWPYGLIACQAPLSMGFSRQEYWNGLPFPSPGDLPIPEIEHSSPALQADSLPTELRWKLCSIITVIIEYLYLLML